MRPSRYIIACTLVAAASGAVLVGFPRGDFPPPSATYTYDAASSSVSTLWGDGDRDGIPDAAELSAFTDRENFRRWFTRIAENQFYRTSDEWNMKQRDCAGLVRFSLREALRTHDRTWLRRMGAEYEPVAPDVRRYTLERAPLGERLFRTRGGEFIKANTTDSTFSEFADARTLKDFNAEFISRDPREARPGDLLFFYQPWGQHYPYHVMIFIGTPHVAEDGETSADDWVVYHTGASPDDTGTIRKVRLATLDRHPDARWRPVQSNPRFLGFYRLKILT